MVNKRLSSQSWVQLSPVSTSPPIEDLCAASRHVVAQWVAKGNKWGRSLNKMGCFYVKVLIVLTFYMVLTESSLAIFGEFVAK